MSTTKLTTTTPNRKNTGLAMSDRPKNSDFLPRPVRDREMQQNRTTACWRAECRRLSDNHTDVMSMNMYVPTSYPSTCCIIVRSWELQDVGHLQNHYPLPSQFSEITRFLHKTPALHFGQVRTYFIVVSRRSGKTVSKNKPCCSSVANACEMALMLIFRGTS